MIFSHCFVYYFYSKWKKISILDDFWLLTFYFNQLPRHFNCLELHLSRCWFFSSIGLRLNESVIFLDCFFFSQVNNYLWIIDWKCWLYNLWKKCGLIIITMSTLEKYHRWYVWPWYVWPPAFGDKKNPLLILSFLGVCGSMMIIILCYTTNVCM